VLDLPRDGEFGARLGSGPAHLVVSDIEAARAELVERGTDVSEIFHFESGGEVSGPDPQRSDYGSVFSFSDPDGNAWLVQEVREATPVA
jgi:predicted enzyme related to lactoylglutathione lyase